METCEKISKNMGDIMYFEPIPVEFHIGKAVNAYEYLGAHPVCEGGYSFRVWAPGAKQVQVCGDFNDWQGTELVKEPSGVFSGICPEAKTGQFYKYHILGADFQWEMKSDPYAFFAEKRPDTASVLTDLSEFEFHDEKWMNTRDKNYNRPLNIYEIHAGSWKKPVCEEEGEDCWYNYEELAELLIPWLKEHHYTHVELLPLAEHPFDGSWGYQVTGYFAVTSRYGTPKQFAAMVDKLHEAGIGVIMDYVPVHFCKNGNGLSRFDGTMLYEYDSDVGQSEWGTCNFNYYRGEVASFLASAAAIWLDVYHCDGIRMDAISRAVYWQGDPARGVNEGALKFLQNMNRGLHERFPDCMLIAEDSTNYLKVTAPVEYDGLGFDYKWDMGWMHDTLDYFATPFGERKEHYHKLTFSMHYFYQELYLLAFSHDEVVHGKKTIIDKLWGTYEEKFAQARLLYFYMYTHPGKKLNFMGNELAHFREWDEEKELDWKLLKYPLHDAFQKLIAELGRLYEMLPALHDGEYNSQCFTWIEAAGCESGVYAWLRRAQGQTLLCVMNTQDQEWKDYGLYLPDPAKATEIFGTEWECWGGRGAVNSVKKTEREAAGNLLKIDLPAMGGCLLKLTDENEASEYK